LYCQDKEAGGLWDKPGKHRDIYHTCYALSGLSLSQ
jgi:protein farnesyltransferase subunit beta